MSLSQEAMTRTLRDLSEAFGAQTSREGRLIRVLQLLLDTWHHADRALIALKSDDADDFSVYMSRLS
jgi:hypothetical protein